MQHRRYLTPCHPFNSRSLSLLCPVVSLHHQFFIYDWNKTAYISCMHTVRDERIRWKSQTNLCQNGKIHSRNPSLCALAQLSSTFLGNGNAWASSTWQRNWSKWNSIMYEYYGCVASSLHWPQNVVKTLCSQREWKKWATKRAENVQNEKCSVFRMCD